ncbi:MAG: glycosyltransferase [Candidatus Liptonbacteria bacterium]|nr:glycosyltransferase [Candidatus Liptonbacteria bacterium]
MKTLTSFKPDIFIEEGGFLIHDLEKKIDVLRNFKRQGGKVVLHGAMSPELALAIKRDEIVDVYFSEVDPTVEFQSFPAYRFKKMHWLAASRKIHGTAKPIPKYNCDIIYIGANLPKKREAFERILFPLAKKYHVKIYGFGWDFIDRNFLHPLVKIERTIFGSGVISKLRLMRQVPIDLEGSAYASAKISINFHEKQPGADIRTINARTFKIPASGGFEVCDYVPQIREFFDEDELAMPKINRDWFEVVAYYLAHEEERKVMQSKATAKVLKEHTFHNRVHTLLSLLS